MSNKVTIKKPRSPLKSKTNRTLAAMLLVIVLDVVRRKTGFDLGLDQDALDMLAQGLEGTLTAVAAYFRTRSLRSEFR